MKQTPFTNCRFQVCDLPGQCKGEGKCHHPAAPQQEAQEPVGVVRYTERRAIVDWYGLTPPNGTSLYTTPQPAHSIGANGAAGSNAPLPHLAWREQFSTAVYENLAAADNQDIPLEEYPARILKVLDAVVGHRHPTTVFWRNDGIEACAKIAERYGNIDAALHMRSLLTPSIGAEGVDVFKVTRIIASLDAIHADYELSMGKREPDAEMAQIVESTKRRLFNWWATNREIIRAALVAQKGNVVLK